MRHTITAMFDSYQDASEAVTRLKAAGIPDRDISIISNDPAQRDTTRSDYRHDDDSEAGGGAGSGVAVGGALGGGAGLLAGLGLLAIPGLGPVVAAGWLAATLVGAGAGAVAGGLIGALIGAGIPEEDAHTYAEGIRRGGTLVTVRAEDTHHAQALDILDDEGTIRMDERADSWRQEGWNGRYQSDAALGAQTPAARPSTTPASSAPVGRQPSTAPAPSTTTSSAAASHPSATGAPASVGSGPGGAGSAAYGTGERSDAGRMRARSYAVDGPARETARRTEVEIEDNRDRARQTGTGNDDRRS